MFEERERMKDPVLVTAVGSFSAEAVIRTCKEEGFRVLGCDIYPAEWIAASLEVSAFFRAPRCGDAAEYLRFMENVCVREGVKYLLPLTDAEIDVLNGWRRRAGELGVTICVSGEDTIRLCRNKKKLAEFLSAAGVCRTVPGETLADVMAREEASGYRNMAYPLVLKPFCGRSSQGLKMVGDAGAMQRAAEELRETAASYLVQPRIGGFVVTADVVRDPGSGRTVSLPRREFLRTPNGAGTSVYVFRNRELEDCCARLAEALDIRGCVNFEFMEPAEGDWRLLECNPRFSGGVAFSRMAGYDMVRNHLRCFAGGEIEPPEAVRGCYLVKRYTEYCTKAEQEDKGGTERIGYGEDETVPSGGGDAAVAAASGGIYGDAEASLGERLADQHGGVPRDL